MHVVLLVRFQRLPLPTGRLKIHSNISQCEKVCQFVCQRLVVLYGLVQRLVNEKVLKNVTRSLVVISLTCYFVISDPLRSTQGFLSLRAYRLTREMMDFYREGDFTPESLRSSEMSFSRMFEEIPIVLKTSHLANSLLCEIEGASGSEPKFNFLDLATR